MNGVGPGVDRVAVVDFELDRIGGGGPGMGSVGSIGFATFFALSTARISYGVRLCFGKGWQKIHSLRNKEETRNREPERDLERFKAAVC